MADITGPEHHAMKKIEAPATVARMMDCGEFTLWHAWESDTLRVEYWRGNDRNGACVRRIETLGTLQITHYRLPGAALLALVREGFEVPGVAA